MAALPTDQDATQYLAQITALPIGANAEVYGALAKLVEHINGANNFSTEKAAYGYIEPGFRLVVPGTLQNQIPTNMSEPANLGILSILSIAYWNYIRLRNTGATSDHALFVSIYRARLVANGYLYRSRENRSVTVDEVDYPDNCVDFSRHAASAGFNTALQAATTDQGRIRVYIEHGANNNFKRFLGLCGSEMGVSIFKHLLLTANQYAACTYLVFRQFGHHYTSEYEAKYNVLWKATTLDTSIAYPGHEMMHRNAIHSFGVRSLHEKFFQLKTAGRLAETFLDRQDVSPCGTAVIGTCAAAIELMKSLPLWETLYAAYQNQIDTLAGQAQMLKNSEAAIQYHKNARLFGKSPRKLDPNTAYSMAPIAKGFIQSLGDTSDLSKQKTLDKRAQQNPVMVELLAGVINNSMEKIISTGDLSIVAPKGIRRQRRTPGALDRAVGGGVQIVQEAGEPVVEEESSDDGDEEEDEGDNE